MRVHQGLCQEEELKNQVSRLKDAIHQKESQAERYQQEIFDLQSNIEQLSVDLKSMERQRNDLSEKYKGALFDHSMAADQLKNRNQSVHDLEQEVENQKQLLNMERQKNKLAVQNLDQSQNETRRLQEQNLQDQKRLRQREKDIEELDLALNDLKQTMTDEFGNK